MPTSKEQQQQQILTVLLGIGATLLTYKVVIAPILEKLNIIDSAEDKALNEAQLSETAWNPRFYQTAPTGSILITSAAVKMLSKKIYDALNWYGDSFVEVIGALRQLKTKAQVSQLADYFAKTYGLDMYAYLKTGDSSFPGSGLSTENLTTLNNFVKSLPLYK